MQLHKVTAQDMSTMKRICKKYIEELVEADWELSNSEKYRIFTEIANGEFVDDER